MKNLEKSLPSAEAKPIDYDYYFTQWEKSLDVDTAKDYLEDKGISLDTAKRFKLGFASEWNSLTADSMEIAPPPSPRLIIPTGTNSYIARDVRQHLDDDQKQHEKIIEGQSNMFNVEALYSPRNLIFVTRDEIDALSFEELGYSAVALVRAKNAKMLLSIVQSTRLKSTLIFPQYDDDVWQKTITYICQRLYDDKVNYLAFDNLLGCKSPNEALVKNRDAFDKAIRNFIHDKVASGYSCAEFILSDFVENIKNSIYVPCFQTGFARLDNALDGGFRASLTVIGAISSLGKTTFTLQLADQIASHGKDVLFFSLEMSKFELMGKSISRNTFLQSVSSTGNPNLGKTYREILNGLKYKEYSFEEIECINDAIKQYHDISKHIFIREGMGNIGVKDIRETIGEFICNTGRKPLVIIDYFQVLSPYSNHLNDKQNTDQNIFELKRISRDFDLPIIAISSLNRASYTNGIQMSSFKESGSIEYSSDILIGLQLKGMTDGCPELDTLLSQNPRRIELKIIKNRSGISGTTIDYDYFCDRNWFIESE